MSSSKIADAAYELRELSAAELAMVAGGAFIGLEQDRQRHLWTA